MMIYRCVITLESPTIVSSKRTERGFFSELKYIPASTLGGAVNRVLNTLSNGKPRVICTPAYTLARSGEATIPAHPFVYRCKGEEAKVFSSLKELNTPLVEVVSRDKVKNSLLRLECSEKHPVKSLHPNPVSLNDHNFSIDFISLVSIGINREAASTNIGLFYEYEAIAPGPSFIFYAAVLDESINLKELRRTTMHIGRGVSRGFGRAVVKEIEEINVYDEEERLRRDGVFPLYVLSPLLLENKDSNITNIIEDAVDLARHAGLLEIGERVDGVLAPAGLDISFFGTFSRYSMGYDLIKGVQRPYVTCLNPGSIVLCRWSSPPSKESLSMVFMKYIGLPVKLDKDFILYGLSMLSPFEKEPIEEVVR